MKNKILIIISIIMMSIFNGPILTTEATNAMFTTQETSSEEDIDSDNPETGKSAYILALIAVAITLSLLSGPKNDDK